MKTGMLGKTVPHRHFVHQKSLRKYTVSEPGPLELLPEICQASFAMLFLYIPFTFFIWMPAACD